MASSTIITSLFFFLLLTSSSYAPRPSPNLFNKPTSQNSPFLPNFSRAPKPSNSHHHGCSNGHVNVAMTLDFNSLQGLISSIFSILSHSSCPNNLRFHFLISSDDDNNYRTLLEFIFPWLRFQISTFEQKTVQTLVDQKFVHNPLSYARSYLGNVLPSSVNKVIYLTANVIVLDDIANLWNTKFHRNSSVIAAPKYCVEEKQCYFKTGVMVVDLGRWREGKYTEKLEGWMMKMLKGEMIYDPMVMTFKGQVEGIDERWNRDEFDLDGDCKMMNGEGEVSLVHWSGKEKEPWERLDQGKDCAHKLAQYDLYRSKST